MNTDTQLKQALAKMLPDVIDTEWTDIDSIKAQFYGLVWQDSPKFTTIKDTELLHLCQLARRTLQNLQKQDYYDHLVEICGTNSLAFDSTWQQRVIALSKVKGIEV